MSTNQQNGGVGWLNRMFFHFIVISEKHVIYKMWDYVYVIKGHVLFFFFFLWTAIGLHVQLSEMT